MRRVLGRGKRSIAARALQVPALGPCDSTITTNLTEVQRQQLHCILDASQTTSHLLRETSAVLQ
jgi:hypothetical protein